MRLWKQPPMRSVAFEAFGVRLAVTLGDAGLYAGVREILPPGWRSCDEADAAGQFGLRQTEADGYEVTVGGVPWIEHATLDVALGMLDAQIRQVIAAKSPDRVFVHAGVVAWDGRAIVVPGESFSGKTTLVSALVEEGATYYSDEYALFDGEGCIDPYPRRLSIRSADGAPQRERHVGELGGVAATDSAELAAVVVTRYRRGVKWQPKRLSAGEGVLALLANTVPAQERPAESLRALSRAVAGATVLDGDRGEASIVAAALLDELTVGAPR